MLSPPRASTAEISAAFSKAREAVDRRVARDEAAEHRREEADRELRSQLSPEMASLMSGYGTLGGLGRDSPSDLMKTALDAGEPLAAIYLDEAAKSHALVVALLGVCFSLIGVGFALFVMGVERAFNLEVKDSGFGSVLLRSASPGTLCILSSSALICVLLFTQFSNSDSNSDPEQDGRAELLFSKAKVADARAYAIETRANAEASEIEARAAATTTRAEAEAERLEMAEALETSAAGLFETDTPTQGGPGSPVPKPITGRTSRVAGN